MFCCRGLLLLSIFSMRYSGIQPQYFPRLHYFARILNSDIYLIRDEVQYLKKHKYPDGTTDKSYQSHTPVKQTFGRFLLSVPIKREGFIPIGKTEVSYGNNWVETHLKTIEICYSKAPNYQPIYRDMETILNMRYKTIADLNIAAICWAIQYLINKGHSSNRDLSINSTEQLLKKSRFRLRKIIRGSHLTKTVNLDGLSADEKIIKLIKAVGANEDYCGGTAIAAYMHQELFKKNGIKITVQDWHCPPYPQQFNKLGFIPDLSIIDLFMNVSPQNAVKILLG